MRSVLLTLTILCFLVVLTGASCSPTGLAESATSDIRGWDLSACVNGFGTCWELFWDNREQIEGGSGTVTDLLNPLKPGEHEGLTK